MTVALVILAVAFTVVALSHIAANAKIDGLELERRMLMNELRAFRTVYAKELDGRHERQ